MLLRFLGFFRVRSKFFFQVLQYFSRFLPQNPVFPGFPGMDLFFQVFQVRWEPWYEHKTTTRKHQTTARKRQLETMFVGNHSFRLYIQFCAADYTNENWWRYPFYHFIFSHTQAARLCPNRRFSMRVVHTVSPHNWQLHHTQVFALNEQNTKRHTLSNRNGFQRNGLFIVQSNLLGHGWHKHTHGSHEWKCYNARNLGSSTEAGVRTKRHKTHPGQNSPSLGLSGGKEVNRLEVTSCFQRAREEPRDSHSSGEIRRVRVCGSEFLRIQSGTSNWPHTHTHTHTHTHFAAKINSLINFGGGGVFLWAVGSGTGENLPFLSQKCLAWCSCLERLVWLWQVQTVWHFESRPRSRHMSRHLSARNSDLFFICAESAEFAVDSRSRRLCVHQQLGQQAWLSRLRL